MSTFKKFAAAAFAIGALVAVTPAKAIIVGGIDFGIIGANPFNNHIETTTIAASFAGAAGDASISYGQISTVNGDSTYCADGTANCSLYFIVNNTVSAGSAVSGTMYFNNTTVSIYYSAGPLINLFNQDSLANLAYISGLTTWATLTGENGVDATASGLLADTKVNVGPIGQTIAVTGSGLLSVNLGDGLGNAAVEAYLNANSIATFNGTFADIAYTESADNLILNPFDIANGLADSCFTGSPVVGDWCLQGSADLRGNTVVVPLPGSLALIGLGLVAIGAARRRVIKI